MWDFGSINSFTENDPTGESQVWPAQASYELNNSIYSYMNLESFPSTHEETFFYIFIFFKVKHNVCWNRVWLSNMGSVRQPNSLDKSVSHKNQNRRLSKLCSGLDFFISCWVFHHRLIIKDGNSKTWKIKYISQMWIKCQGKTVTYTHRQKWQTGSHDQLISSENSRYDRTGGIFIHSFIF